MKNNINKQTAILILFYTLHKFLFLMSLSSYTKYRIQIYNHKQIDTQKNKSQKKREDNESICNRTQTRLAFITSNTRHTIQKYNRYAYKNRTVI